MNVALIGYGKMGKEVEQVAKQKGITVGAVFTDENNPNGSGITPDSLRDIDVCVEFSTTATVLDNVEAVARCGKSIIVGTTGWQDKLEYVKRLVKEKNIGFLHASNFSLGVNIFSQVVMDASRMFDKYADYDVSIHEVHHKEKTDSPSGTALTLGSVILQSSTRKTEVFPGMPHEQIRPHQLHITSERVGNVMGTHTVLFDSECDSIELVHTARSRRGFAVGALIAAEWLNGKKGFYTMRDVILP